MQQSKKAFFAEASKQVDAKTVHEFCQRNLIRITNNLISDAETN